MAVTTFRGMKPFPQLMFTLFIIIVCFIVLILVAGIMSIPLFGLESLMKLSTGYDFKDPEIMNVLKYFQVVQSIGVFIIPPLVAAWFYSDNLYNFLFIRRSFHIATGLLIVVLMILAAPFINFTGEINGKMVFPEWLSGLEEWMRNTEDKAAELTEAFLKVRGIGGLFFNIFMVALLPSLGEELLFRGVIQRIFTRMTRNHHWGIWISAILFSALHMQFYGFIPRMLLGVMFGYLLVWSGNLWMPILAHFCNNAFAVIAMYLVDKEMISPDIEKIGSTTGSYYLAIISMGLIVLMLWQIKNQNKQNEIALDELQE